MPKAPRGGFICGASELADGGLQGQLRFGTHGGHRRIQARDSSAPARHIPQFAGRFTIQ